MTTEGKYVYIARNPCDVCVSFYHMVTNMSISEYRNGTFEDFVDTIVSGNFGYGDYFEHVAAEKDEALFQRLLERSQPEYMRNVAVFDATDINKPQWSEVLLRKKITCGKGYEGDENKYCYVRVGKVGTWKNYFTPHLLRKMENRILEAQKQPSFMDLWKDIRVETIEVLKGAK
ncbi:sulfotransferase ssu-1-like [Rhipicephalus microplus]|uniref:sulfotransferase ssu-1-like n=1 Tax=Rhipicephalus microplus TaxID=6941 RepID=UPI003F6A7FF6